MAETGVASNLWTNICKTIFVFLEVQFHHEGGLSETRYFELFSRHGLFFTMPKISLHWVPLQPFLNINHDFGHICFLKKLWTFFGSKSGSYSGQKIISFSLGVFFDWETSIYFCPLFVHFRTQGDTLTYSALRLEKPQQLDFVGNIVWPHYFFEISLRHPRPPNRVKLLLVTFLFSAL